ncbi:hypothetical protein NB706_003671 [Xanthomonas sacchari]|nr:hypothetical protein [Xanthomonas sacchari]
MRLVAAAPSPPAPLPGGEGGFPPRGRLPQGEVIGARPRRRRTAPTRHSGNEGHDAWDSPEKRTGRAPGTARCGDFRSSAPHWLPRHDAARPRDLSTSCTAKRNPHSGRTVKWFAPAFHRAEFAAAHAQIRQAWRAHRVHCRRSFRRHAGAIDPPSPCHSLRRRDTCDGLRRRIAQRRAPRAPENALRILTTRRFPCTPTSVRFPRPHAAACTPPCC